MKYTLHTITIPYDFVYVIVYFIPRRHVILIYTLIPIYLIHLYRHILHAYTLQLYLIYTLYSTPTIHYVYTHMTGLQGPPGHHRHPGHGRAQRGRQAHRVAR